MAEKATKQNKIIDHFTQVDADYLSKAFSAIKDEIGIMGNLPIEYRPHISRNPCAICTFI